MRKFFASFVIGALFCGTVAQGQSYRFAVGKNDVHGSYISERIELKGYKMPVVQLTDPAFHELPGLPDKAVAGNPSDLKILMGMEQKRPFAVVQVPAYSQNAAGKWQQLSSFTLNVTEATATEAPATAAKGTAANSVLASGTWYKISVPARGIYKVDYSFLQSKLGITGGISSANIRLFGNGGTMLSEKTSDARPDDLVENAITVNDGGDGNFDGQDFFTFYAGGPMAWDKDSVNQRFGHRKNVYADSSYYFITVDQGAGLRIGTQGAVGTPNYTVSDFNDYAVHEEDLYNPGKFGKEWLGENFGNLTTRGNSAGFSFYTGTTTTDINARIVLADRSSVSGSIFTVTMNGQSFNTIPFTAASIEGDGPPYSVRTLNLAVPGSGNNTAVQLTYSPAANDGTGYLNAIELNYRRALIFANGQLSFRDWRSVGSGRVATYKLEGANGNVQVWDVTNPLQPVRMNGSLSGTTYTFNQDAAILHEFIALDGSAYGTPQFSGKVPNQNIHGSGPVDLILVTPEPFLTAANELADMHRQRDQQRVLVATTAQIYNEFSSGGQDVTAIRDLARMFYTRAGSDPTLFPKNILLFGDASYDYKDRVIGNTNFVPTFESRESVNLSSSYVVDEYYTMLDDNENIEDLNLINTLDIGVGRLPVKSPEEAKAIVTKIKTYHSPASLGPWRISNTYIGDNEDDAGDHLMDAEYMCNMVNTETNQLYNNAKIYLDNLPFISTPGGARCPDGNKAINDDIFKGTFMINFTGHGSTVTLTHERVLTADDFNNWKNVNKLPFMITATCDFSRYDHPEYVSAGEKLIVKEDGGAIAMLTTTAAVYASLNKPLDSNFLQAQFNQHNGDWFTFGEAYRRGKNVTYANEPDVINNRAFILLGDPALTPAFPKYFVHTDSITDNTTGVTTDSFKALGSYTVNGRVSDVNDQVLSQFNGKAYITIYDKARTVSLRTKVYNTLREFQMQDNIIYKGIATVTNGHFSCTFIAPKDLNYDFGKGRISYYAENGETDGAGLDDGVIVGGFSDNPVTDNDGPIVKPYINDTLFRDGAVTGTNTSLYVKLYDETGINVSGNGVGHDLTAVLDNNLGTPYILNDYYQTEPNTYKRGYVSFPVTGIPDGPHTFTVKAWDVNNNSGEGKVNFVVTDGRVLTVQNLMNYPNPFSDVTHFIFEHNHPNENFTVQIGIFSVDGRKVRILEQKFLASGSHSNEMTWDGTDENGARIPAGVYPYRMILTTEKGVQTTAYQKLVYMR